METDDVINESNPTFEVQNMGNEAFQNASIGMRVTVASWQSITIIIIFNQIISSNLKGYQPNRCSLNVAHTCCSHWLH